MLTTVMNLGNLLTQVARRHPTEPGFITPAQTWTWSEINRRVDAVCAALRERGVGKGDKILVHSRNNLPLFESAYVAFKLGAVWVPTNYRIAPPEAAYLAKSSGARVMIYDAGFEEYVDVVRAASPALEIVVALERARAGELAYESLASAAQEPFDAEEVGRDDPLWFFYTSGTTGHPKAGTLTHGQMAFVVTNHLADLMPGIDYRSRSLVVAPLSHGAGIHAIVNTARGAASIVPASERLDPEEVWSLVQQHRVDNMFTVPTIVKMLTEHEAVDRYDHSSLRFVIYAGAPMYRADQKHALKKLGRVLVQYYGLGEVTGNITVLPPWMHEEDDDAPNCRAGTCGFPRTGIEVAICDEDGKRLQPFETGEICVRGPAVMIGYDNNPEANAKAFRHGWFHTGDLGHVDREGFLFITGRSSDMYISGGSNVYPREVEEALLTHDSVHEVAVLGMPDPKWGELGVAVVVCKPGNRPLAEDLIRHLEGRLARYKWPRHVVFWDALPKSAYGKITKKDVRSLLSKEWEKYCDDHRASV
ncbi:AMP-dependent synthetase and ligase [Caballeronia calidae]|uniref:AMP-dependent synthetase and ligase n=1 Tax=Caballeronia calidae TaxID=1777139 RepID=A0A158A4J0_9BURK|nr:acyl-CoA synthetase [Caballeronia calidae]SAK52017.1 AMP-dependent synthetase and ligase [Caballeronia calidae]